MKRYPLSNHCTSIEPSRKRYPISNYCTSTEPSRKRYPLSNHCTSTEPSGKRYPLSKHLQILNRLGRKESSERRHCRFKIQKFCPLILPVTKYKSLSSDPSESEFNECETRLKSAEKRFQLSAGLNLGTLKTNLSETNHILAASQI